MSVVLNFGRDTQGMNAYAPFTAGDKWSATITNGAETHITVPSNHAKWIAVFSYQPGTNIWVDLTGASAIVPVGATLASTTSELNPAARLILAAGKISMITDNASADVGVALYAVENN